MHFNLPLNLHITSRFRLFASKVSPTGTAYTHDGEHTAEDETFLMFSEPNGNGTLKKTIEGDKLGNFYTTDITSFGNGLFPAVVYNNDTTFMGSSITNGSCNSCDGNSTSKIEVD